MLKPESPPELMTTRWFNTDQPRTLANMKGKVIVLSFFQMLCPGCLKHGLPLTDKLFKRFNSEEVAVIGLHSVFEHHEVMRPEALEVFIRQYKWGFPIGVDAPGPGDKAQPSDKDNSELNAPKTMQAYELRGTPTILLFDRKGRLRRHYFGQPDEIILGAEVMALAIEPADAPRDVSIGIEALLTKTLIMPGIEQPPPANKQDNKQDGAAGKGHEHGPGCDHS